MSRKSRSFIGQAAHGQHQGQPRTRRGPGSSGSWAGAVALALSYLLLGHLIPGISAGLSALLLILGVSSVASSSGTVGPRAAAAATVLTAVLAVALTAWWSWIPPHNGAPSSPALARRVEETFPELGGSITERATFLLENAGVVLSSLTTQEFFHLAFHSLGALVAWVVAFVALVLMTQWWAFRNVTARAEHRPRVARWGLRFIQTGWGPTASVLIMSRLGLAMTSGWATVLIGSLQARSLAAGS